MYLVFEFILAVLILAMCNATNYPNSRNTYRIEGAYGEKMTIELGNVVNADICLVQISNGQRTTIIINPDTEENSGAGNRQRTSAIGESILQPNGTRHSQRVFETQFSPSYLNYVPHSNPNEPQEPFNLFSSISTSHEQLCDEIPMVATIEGEIFELGHVKQSYVIRKVIGSSEISIYPKQQVIIFKQLDENAFDVIDKYFDNPTNQIFPFVGFENIKLTGEQVKRLDYWIREIRVFKEVIFHTIEFVDKAIYEFTFENCSYIEDICFSKCNLNKNDIKYLREIARKNEIGSISFNN